MIANDYDVVVFDPTTPARSRYVIEAQLRKHRRVIPIVRLDGLEGVVGNVRLAIAVRRY